MEKRKIKTSVFIAASLDGFIAREDGSLDWLDKANESAPSGEDCGYKKFMESVDVLIMGRLTYEKILTFGFWPYENKRVVVLSQNHIKISDEWKHSVFSSSEEPNQVLSQLASEGFKHAYIDGGLTIQSFLREGLIDEITITQVPVLIGQGKSLFGFLEHGDVSLGLTHCHAYDFGYVQMTYKILSNKT